MQAEIISPITNLDELGEINPSAETIRELRKAFEEILQQRGKEIKGPGILPMFSEKYRAFSTELVVGEKRIPVFIYRPKTRYPNNVRLSVDIGMRISNGERVRLEFWPGGQIGWLSLERSLLTNRTFPGSSPTRNDLGLYKQVLDALVTGA